MTDNPCNCNNNCKFHGEKRQRDGEGIRIFDCCNEDWLSNEQVLLIKSKGCLSHSQYREYMMKDMIMYLIVGAKRCKKD
jgi:hypothetical protein